MPGVSGSGSSSDVLETRDMYASPPLSPGWRPGKLVEHIRDRRKSRRRQREHEQVARWQQEGAQQEGEWEKEEEEEEEEEEEDYEYVERPGAAEEGGRGREQELEHEQEDEGEDVTLEEYDALRHRSPRRQEKGRERVRVQVQVRAPPPPTTEGGGGGGGGDWYLGKLTGRLMRRGLLALVGEEEAQRRRDGAPVVARLRVAFKGVRGLKKALNPYLEVMCEGTRRVLKPSHFREEGAGASSSEEKGGLDPEWGEAVLSFAVSDITTNVHVLLLDKVGRCVPLWLGGNFGQGGSGALLSC
jgi:hypothetical protein